LDLLDFLHLLGPKIRHFFMKKLDVYDALHDPDDDFGYVCCDDFISKERSEQNAS
jgi:hypothetical protein